MLRREFSLAGLLFAALSLLCVTVSAAADERQQREAVDAVFAEYDRASGAGVVVGVYQAGQQRYARAFGMANLEDNVVLSTDTIFPMASVSKHFTAFAILLLARDGKVDLDADIRTYLPSVPDFGQRITVRHLLLHNSGLRDLWGMFWFAGIESPQGGQALGMKMVQRQRALNFAPGSEHQYSNTGYLLAAEIVKAVSGQSLREFTTKRMFQPLGMNHTFFLDDTTELVPGRPASYCWKYFYCQNEAQAWRRELGGSDVVGPTGLYATAGDLAKWAGNFMNPTVGDRALIDQFVSLGNLDGGAPINYGFGLWHQKLAGHEAIMHNGANEAFRTVFVVLPEEKLSVTIMANTMMDVGQLAESVVRIYLGERRSEPAVIPKAVVADAATVAAVAGHYQRIGQVHIAFDGKGRQLRRVSPTALPVPMQFRADGTFDAGDEDRRGGRYFKPVRDASGAVIALDQGGTGQDPFSDTGGPLRHLRVAAIDASKVDLREFVGDYRSDELDFTCRLSLVNGALVLDALRLQVPIPLTPTHVDGFQGKRYFLHVVAERDAAGRVSALLASSASDRNVRFDRVK